jgi:hypothetical protein
MEGSHGERRTGQAGGGLLENDAAGLGIGVGEPSSARPEIVAGQKDRAGAKTAGAGGGTARLGTPLELLDFELKGGFDVLLVHGISPFIDRTEGDDGEIRILLPGSPSNLRNRE